MKILLVYCNSMLENALPVSISQLVACLKAADFDVNLFDTTFYKWGAKSAMETRMEALQFPPCPVQYRAGDVYEDFNHTIESSQPDLIGFSVVEPTFRLGLRLLSKAESIIKRNKIRVAFGGVHAILAPETFIGQDLIDFLCISEGENAFVELCRRLRDGKSADDLNGFWIYQRDGGHWIKNQKAPLVNLETLPIMDFSLFGEAYLHKPMMGKVYRTISIETTRGCPYWCSYCSDHSLREMFRTQGLWYRQKSLPKVSSELATYVQTYRPEFVYILSEAFLAGNMRRLEQFAEVYKPHSIPFWFNTRPEDITAEKVKVIKELGCRRISIGLEHGNEKFRKAILHRGYSNEIFLRACRILHDNDISFSVNVIIGFPDETRELIFDSIDLLRKAKPDGVSVHILNPYHGSEIRETCVKKGYVKSDQIAGDFFEEDYLLDQPGLSKTDIKGLFRTIPLYVDMDRAEHPRIRQAEQLDENGNRVFHELKQEYYALKHWTPNPS
jgi:anaerobic magnesium-protoporphyrin IX monomethyl ester cyclase